MEQFKDRYIRWDREEGEFQAFKLEIFGHLQVHQSETKSKMDSTDFHSIPQRIFHVL